MKIKEQSKRGLIAYIVKNPIPVILSLVILSLSGFVIHQRLGVDILPNLNFPLFNVITHYSGASPEDMEVLITRPLEGALSGLKNSRRISSVSAQGFSRVTIEFVWGTDVAQAEQQVVASLARIRGVLPSDARPVIENIGSTLQEVAGYSVKSTDGKISQTHLRNLVEYKIAPMLRAADGVSKIDVCGGGRESYIVDVNRYARGDYGVGLGKIADDIKASNVQTHLGFLSRNYLDFPISGIGTIKSVEDLQNVIVGYNSPNPPLLLGKLSRIFKGVLPERYMVRTDGVSGVVFSVYKQPNVSTLVVARNIKRIIRNIKKGLPEGVSVEPYYDQSQLIQSEAHNLSVSILIGSILVIIVLMLLLGDAKGGIVIALTIPQIVLVSFLFIYLSGYTLNILTLGAYAVAIGMIVDGSIIILENIYRHRRMGMDKINGAILGTKEIMGADISGVLTTVAVFFPLLLLGGLPGRLFIPFGFVIAVTLICSLVLSLTFIPAMMGCRKNIDDSGRHFSDGFFDMLKSVNGKLLHLTLRHKKGTIIASAVAFIIVMPMLFFSPVGFLPDIDEGAILCEYILPPGTSIEESGRIAKRIEAEMQRTPEVKSTYLRVGSAEGTYQVERVNRGEIVAKLMDNGNRRSLKDVIADMRKRIGKIQGIITFFHQPTLEKIDESFSGLPVMFGITVYGDDYAKLSEYAKRIEKIAKGCPYIGGVVNNAVIKVPEIRVKLDRKKLNLFGLKPEAVLREVKFAMNGGVVTNVIENEKTVPVFLIGGKFPPSKKNIDDLKRIPIALLGGGFAMLSDVASITDHYGINEFDHTNLRREITISIEPDGSIGSIAKWLNPRIAALNIPSDYFVEYVGQYKSLIESAKGLLLASILAIAVVYLIMLMQFGSVFQPLVILFELPLSFIGGCIALIVTHQPINLSSLIGFLTLIGVAVNNGIILISYANSLRKNGMGRESALKASTEIRVRPIFITTITTVFGLIPVALGSTVHRPLAVVVMGGLLLSAFLTLNVLPVIYSALEDIALRLKLRLSFKN